MGGTHCSWHRDGAGNSQARTPALRLNASKGAGASMPPIAPRFMASEQFKKELGTFHQPGSDWPQPFQGSVFCLMVTQGSSPGEQPWAKCWNPFGVLAMNRETGRCQPAGTVALPGSWSACRSKKKLETTKQMPVLHTSNFHRRL